MAKPAYAITHGYAALTSNTNDYKKVPELNVLNPNYCPTENLLTS